MRAWKKILMIYVALIQVMKMLKPLLLNALGWPNLFLFFLHTCWAAIVSFAPWLLWSLGAIGNWHRLEQPSSCSLAKADHLVYGIYARYFVV